MAAAQLPASIRVAWEQQAADDFPGLDVSEASWLRCSLGLAQFFEACRLQAGQGPCALPSKAADSVWHVGLKVDPSGLAAWQQRHFGRVVEHTEAQALGASLHECLTRTWAGACRSEGLSLLGPQLPLVFALDSLIGLPTGWAYRHQGGALVHRRIDGFGKPSGAVVRHAVASAASLVTLGLLSDAELQALRRRQSDGSGSSSSDSSSCDAASDGGGCDAGSSCGSGCGGD
ncbi:hypothetical protein DBR42_09400 [Pelomonas sp. HMWF004]|nr:hypothetical protein DBR42_09400 [Pelomonas sp. HMWF004]